MTLTPDQIPQPLIRQLFELDADFVEALWGLDQPPGKLNAHKMLRDTLDSLGRLPLALSQFRHNLPRHSHSLLATLEPAIRLTLSPSEAYNMVPGRDPQNC